MSLVKMAALEALAAAMAEVVDPEITGHAIIVQDADPNQPACFPNLVVRAVGVWAFETLGEEEIDTTATTQTVQIGDLSGRVELILSAKSRRERAKLEDRILGAFGTVGRPGVLLVQLEDLEVSGVPLASQVPVAFLLGDSAWQEEMAFDLIRQDVLELDVEIPVLVTRTGVYDINTLVSALTEDLTTDATALADDDVEQVAITTDGDLEDYP